MAVTVVTPMVAMARSVKPPHFMSQKAQLLIESLHTYRTEHLVATSTIVA